MVDLQKVEKAISLLLEGLGEDPSRPGLVETPKRVARMFEEITAGYDDDYEKHLSKVFPTDNTDIVLEKDITFFSTCEHHILPFFGKAHIAYVPQGKVVGLSKLARVVDTFAKRLQIQEQMCSQIADSIESVLAPLGVMVVVEAEHTCMTMRGIKKVGSKTVTVSTRGCFKDNYEMQKSVRDLIG